MMSDVRPEAFFAPTADAELKALPKCNVHTHLEGSIRGDTLWELARAQGIRLDGSREDMPGRIQVDGSERNLVDYLDKIGYAYQILKDKEALRRTAFEAAEDAARDGVIYLELRAGPMIHTAPGLPTEQVIQSMLDGLKQAEQQYGMVCGLIVAGLRNHDPALNVRLAEIACDFKGAGVVGFDLAGDEAGYPPQLHEKAMRTARKGGLGLTLHAGEAGGAENVRYAVEELGVDRIGHGINSRMDPAVMDLLRERGVMLEMCPTSNVHTRTVAGIQDHPVRQYFERGIPITIGDDDPITSGTRVSNELTLLRSVFGFSLAELAQIQLMTLEAAFLEDESTRQWLCRMVEDAL
jgi:adenosine deaminase